MGNDKKNKVSSSNEGWIVKPQTGVSYGNIVDTPPATGPKPQKPKDYTPDIPKDVVQPSTPKTGTSSTKTTKKYRAGGSKSSVKVTEPSTISDTKITESPVVSDTKKTTPSKKKIDDTGIRLDITKPTEEEISEHLTREVINKEVSLQPDEKIWVKYETPSGIFKYKSMEVSDYAKWEQELTTYAGYRVVRLSKETGDVFFRVPTSKEWNKAYRDELRERYEDTGWIPTWYIAQTDIPKDIDKETYVKTTYELGLGLINAKTASDRINKTITIDWMKEHGTGFDNPLTEQVESYKTWQELKKAEPGLYLEKTKEGFGIVFDPVRYQKEEEQKHKGDILWQVGKLFGEVFGEKRWAAGYEQISGGTYQLPINIAKKTTPYKFDIWYGSPSVREASAYDWYEYSQLWSKGDIKGGAIKAAQSPFVIAPISFGVGAGFSLAFKGISLAASTATGTAEKVLSSFSKVAPPVFAGTVTTTIGTDIGMTAALEPESLPKKLGLYGIGFASAGMGAKWAMNIKTPSSLENLGYKTKVVIYKKFPKTYIETGMKWKAFKFRTAHSFIS